MDFVKDNGYKKIYDVFVSYANKDQDLAKQIIELFTEKGVTVLSTNYIRLLDQSEEIISSCKYFIPIITENTYNSKQDKDKLILSIKNFSNRLKKIIPISFVSFDKIPEEFKSFIKNFQIFYVNENNDVSKTIISIEQTLNEVLDKEKLYEKLFEYTKINNDNKKAETISKILKVIYSQLKGEQEITLRKSSSNNTMSPEDLKKRIKNAIKMLEPKEQRILILRYGLDGKRGRTLDEIAREYGVTRERIRQLESRALKKPNEFIKTKELIKETLRLYASLSNYSGDDTDNETRRIAHEILDSINPISSMIMSDPKITSEYAKDLLFSSIIIQLIYLDRQIKYACGYIISHGDIGNTQFYPIEEWISNQKPYVEAYNALKNEISDYFDDELEIINNTPKCIVENFETISVNQLLDNAYGTNRGKKKENIEVVSEDDEILISIAKFMQEGNKLFDVLQKKKLEGSFLRCLLTSYERLKAYCDVVGANNISAECVDRIVEIKNIIDKHNNNQDSNTKAEKGIKSLLGFTLQDSGEYDVFISFKSEDSDLATTIYNYCLKQLLQPFFSKKTLPELSDSDYSKAIYNALDNSKHFVVVLSKLEYLKTKWISQEMEVFNTEVVEGRKNNANFIFVVTDDLYDYIISNNKKCIDIQYRKYEIIKISEFENKLSGYLKK